MRNPELARIVREFYLAEYHAGRFWSKGAWLLASTADPAHASVLLAHWEAAASTEITKEQLTGWGGIGRMVQEPKFVLSAAIFHLGERSSQERIWRAFPALSESDQRVVTQAAQGVLDIRIAGAIIHLLDSAKSDDVRQHMVHAANGLLYHILSTKGINGDWVERETGPLIEELSRRGLVMDCLGKMAGK